MLEIILMSTSTSVLFLWVLMGVWTRNEYEKLSYKDGKLIRELPSVPFFLLMGMVGLYKLQKNPEIQFK